jgi:hypothetical protein
MTEVRIESRGEKKRTTGESKGDEEVGCHQGEAGGRVGEAILKTARYGDKVGGSDLVKRRNQPFWRKRSRWDRGLETMGR